MKLLKNSVTMRGDSLYCPLSLSIDAYGNCLTDCHHCYMRHLNHTWGQDLKPADLEALDKKLTAGPKNKNPKTPLAWALSQKKTIRLGNKTDPFQDAEREHRMARKIIQLLIKHRWTFVIQTRFTHMFLEYEVHLLRAHRRSLLTLMPVISPGLEKDWELFERKRTTMPEDRMKHLAHFRQQGVPGGVNGEPFIPGFHTPQDFATTIKLLKAYGINRYNTYNFHFNAYVAKRLVNLPGVDIEKIWYHNQDEQWKKILAELLEIAKAHDVILGCPDFVNTGWDWKERANTCCGVDVPNPCTFNTHFFKKLRQEGLTLQEVLDESWDGTGDRETGCSIVLGSCKDFYNLNDIQ